MRVELLEFFQDVEDVAVDQKLNKDILNSNFLDSFLESGIGEHHIVTVAINKQNVLIFNLSMATRDASVFQVLTLVAVVQLNLPDSVLLLLPLS